MIGMLSKLRLIGNITTICFMLAGSFCIFSSIVTGCSSLLNSSNLFFSLLSYKERNLSQLLSPGHCISQHIKSWLQYVGEPCLLKVLPYTENCRNSILTTGYLTTNLTDNLKDLSLHALYCLLLMCFGAAVRGISLSQHLSWSAFDY